MPQVKFTQALKRFYPNLDTLQINASTVAEIVAALDHHFPGLKDYVVDEQGKLRQHVNIFIGNQLIHDKVKLSDQVTDQDEIYIMQALSGG